MTIEPTPEQLERLATAPDPGPVVMLNLLRFKARAEGIDAAEGISGAEAYARYGATVAEFIVRAGAHVILTAAAGQSLIGPQEAEWDLAVAVEYPSRRAFLEMISDPRYLEIHRHRAAALADSRLIVCEALAV